MDPCTLRTRELEFLKKGFNSTSRAFIALENVYKGAAHQRLFAPRLVRQHTLGS